MKVAEFRLAVRLQAVRACDTVALLGAWVITAWMVDGQVHLHDLLKVGVAAILAQTLGPTRRSTKGLVLWRQGVLAVPILTVGVIAATLWFLGHPCLTRILPVWALFGPALFMALRLLGFLADRALLDAGIGRDSVVLVGSAAACDRVEAEQDFSHLHDSRLVARYETDEKGDPPADLAARLAGFPSLRVIVCPDGTGLYLTETVLELLRHVPVTVQWAPRFDGTMATFRRVATLPLVDLRASPLDPGQLMIKWIEDKVLAVIILAIVAVPMAAVALLVKLTSRGPVLFTQDRHGLHGSIIKVYKFRSMRCGPPPATPSPPVPPVENPANTPNQRRKASFVISNAPAASTHRAPDEDSDQTLPKKDASGATPTIRKPGKEDDSENYLPTLAPFRQTEENDPRLSPIGTFIRKTSLDELPQLFNVLKGDMSIVGPRPHAVQHNLEYIGSVQQLMRRHYIKPGITGLAQVSGARGATRTIRDMRRRVAMDMIYMQNWSLLLDLKILFMTAFRGIFTKQP
jgi:exopolysaccharide biosynthesis polyprenyl glycosylphosphotransferase